MTQGPGPRSRGSGPRRVVRARPCLPSHVMSTNQAALPKENGLIEGVELRGLEPLTPTLPGRHDHVRGSSPSFHKPDELRVWALANADARPRTARNATTIATTTAGS